MRQVVQIWWQDKWRVAASCRRRGVSLMKASAAEWRALTADGFLGLPQSELTASCSRRPPRQSPWASWAPAAAPAQGLRSLWASCTAAEKEDKDLLAHSPRLPPENPPVCLSHWSSQTRAAECVYSQKEAELLMNIVHATLQNNNNMDNSGMVYINIFINILNNCWVLSLDKISACKMNSMYHHSYCMSFWGNSNTMRLACLLAVWIHVHFVWTHRTYSDN